MCTMCTPWHLSAKQRTEFARLLCRCSVATAAQESGPAGARRGRRGLDDQRQPRVAQCCRRLQVSFSTKGLSGLVSGHPMASICYSTAGSECLNQKQQEKYQHNVAATFWIVYDKHTRCDRNADTSCIVNRYATEGGMLESAIMGGLRGVDSHLAANQRAARMRLFSPGGHLAKVEACF